MLNVDGRKVSFGLSFWSINVYASGSINFVCIYIMVDNALTEKVLLATGGYDHTIKLWHANTGVCNRSLTHLDSVSFETSL